MWYCYKYHMGQYQMYLALQVLWNTRDSGTPCDINNFGAVCWDVRQIHLNSMTSKGDKFHSIIAISLSDGKQLVDWRMAGRFCCFFLWSAALIKISLWFFVGLLLARCHVGCWNDGSRDRQYHVTHLLWSKLPSGGDDDGTSLLVMSW